MLSSCLQEGRPRKPCRGAVAAAGGQGALSCCMVTVPSLETSVCRAEYILGKKTKKKKKIKWLTAIIIKRGMCKLRKKGGSKGGRRGRGEKGGR